MRPLANLFWGSVCLAFLLAVPLRAEEKSEPIYELRTYVCLPGRLDALHRRFRDHTMSLFEKHGMKNVAYWTPAEGEAADNTLIYLLEHSSRDAARESWKAFISDPEWRQVAAESEKDGKILARPPESVYMQKTDFSGPVGPPAADKCYELRVYTAAPGKLDALQARFRDHTDRLFRRHNMISCGYWIPLDPPQSENTLYYILEHNSPQEGRDNLLKKFLADPEWQAAARESEKDGRLVTPPVASTFMNVTDFSPRRDP